MPLNHENDICGYWLHCLKEQVAIRAGKLRILLGAEATDPDLQQYQIRDLHAAQLILTRSEMSSKLLVKQPARSFVKSWFNVAKVP